MSNWVTGTSTERGAALGRVHVLRRGDSGAYETVAIATSEKLAERVAIEHNLAHEIANVLDGCEWDADMLEEVASMLRAAGFTIREPEEV